MSVTGGRRRSESRGTRQAGQGRPRPCAIACNRARQPASQRHRTLCHSDLRARPLARSASAHSLHHRHRRPPAPCMPIHPACHPQVAHFPHQRRGIASGS